jgi:hypothetical protein
VTPRAVRRFVLAVCVVGIAGMIVGSARGDNGVALTFGLVTATAIVCLMVATAVGAGGVARASGSDAAARVDDLSRQLVDGGAPEATVRELVREAVRLGHGSRALRPTRDNDATKREEAGAEVHGGRTPSPSGETFT